MKAKRITKEQAQQLLSQRRGAVSMMASSQTGEYFFTEHHLYEFWREAGKLGFVPVTVHLPHRVMPRPRFPDGWVNTIQDLLDLHHADDLEIDPVQKYGWGERAEHPYVKWLAHEPYHGRKWWAAYTPISERLPTIRRHLASVREKNDGRYEVTLIHFEPNEPFAMPCWQPEFRQRVVMTFDEARALVEAQWREIIPQLN